MAGRPGRLGGDRRPRRLSGVRGRSARVSSRLPRGGDPQEEHTGMTSRTRVAIVIPVYNDWAALSALIPMIDRAFERADVELRLHVIDDGSTEEARIDPRA